MSKLLIDKCPLLPKRRRISATSRSHKATIGSLAHADSRGRLSAAILALEAELDVIVRCGGAPRAPLDSGRGLFVDLLRPAIAATKSSRKFRVPVTAGRSHTSRLNRKRAALRWPA